MLSNEKKNLSDREIVERGSRTLIKELGYSGFIRFIRQMESGGDDYIKLQDDLYKDCGIDEIFDAASRHWENKE